MTDTETLTELKNIHRKIEDSLAIAARIRALEEVKNMILKHDFSSTLENTEWKQVIDELINELEQEYQNG